MASPHDQPTRVQQAVQPQPQHHVPATAGGLDVKTLIITAAASALAAFICSKVWAPGTLASAAFTPVAVALFREALAKPTAVVTSALPAALPITRRGVTSGPGTQAPLASNDPTAVHGVVPGDQLTQVSPGYGPARPGAVGAQPVTVHAVASRSRRRWQIAAITGVLGFVIAAVLITVPEVIAGKNHTTIFQNGGNTPAKKQAAPPATTTTVVQQVTTAPAQTITQTAEQEPTTTTTQTETVTEEAPATTTTKTTPTTTPTTPTTPTTTPDGADPDALTP
ncbi:hypothetical protein AB0L40_17935 [Patulibacter sp. NPDC049589]|uniref:hypothetical protein n=1 Tax=Patulibacter sp. NPDC049589 TaxID=3154731 RepID=UPI00343EEFF1